MSHSEDVCEDEGDIKLNKLYLFIIWSISIELTAGIHFCTQT